ncbi:hypothetical protein PQX77_001631 [Marasmius sp. AFHP31]|nr:hypothetical protein PQX77_001631 [Marasmius sp. AFHP31]
MLYFLKLGLTVQPSALRAVLQRSQSATSNEPQSSLGNLVPQSAGPASKEIAGESADDPQQEKKPKQVGLGTKPLDEKGVQTTDAVPSVPDPTSANKGVLPHTADKDEGRGKSNATDSGAKEQTPLDGTKTDKPTENTNTAKKPSTPEDPTLEKSWEVIMKEVTALDEGLVGGWKDDIDTLLVFAGLFSAVVTAFTIESYKWLQEAPEDTTVTLLKQISQQLNGTSVSDPDEFAVSSSVIAINVLWFLSLIIALVDALFALLCKQWLREHRRHTHTRTPSEALALRWLRNQSLEKWRVPTILAFLPMLLESALFLFLAGLLELLRTRHPALSTIATIVVALAAIFYFGTTIVPTVDILRQARQVTLTLSHARKNPNSTPYLPIGFIMTLPPMEYICPYKSPQAWAAFKVLKLFSRMLPDRYYYAREIMSRLSDWSSVDLELLQRSSIKLAPPFYELGAFRWLVAELRDSPHMIPHLRNILSTFPLHLVMTTVLDQWFFLPQRKWDVSDLEAALDHNLPFDGIEGHLTDSKSLFLTRERQTEKFKHFLHWTHVSMNGGNESSRHSPPPFSTPFEGIDANPNDRLQGHLWNIYTEIIEGLDAPYCLAAFVGDLAMYIIASSPDYALHLPTATTTSSFVRSATGRKFLSDVHSTILERAIYRYTSPKDESGWTEAMDIVRRVHKLPEDHFRVIPGCFSLPPSKLRKTLYSLSPTDTGIDFGYLDSFCRGWSDAHGLIKEEFVKIVSEHINHYPQSDAESSHCPDKSNISPLVMSSTGLELITFVNNRLAEEEGAWQWLQDDGRKGWRDAIERVRAAHPELPQDHLKHIFDHVRYGDLPAPHEHPSQQEARAEDPDDSPRYIANTREVARNVDEIGGRSSPAAGPSPRPEPGELDERGSLVEDAEQGSIPRQPVATGDPASASASGPVQGKVVGGPDADNNV